MAKKLSFDNLPQAVEKILNILSSETSEHTALPELVERITLLEKKIDYLQRSVSPDRPVMDMHEVCRALKLRPKAVSELAKAGVLISREQGRRTVYYQDSVVACFMAGTAWREATAPKAGPTKAEATAAAAEADADAGEKAPNYTAANAQEHRRIDIHTVSELSNRNPAAIYQLVKNGRIPFHKEGRSLYFFADEILEWARAHPGRKYKKRAADENPNN